MNWSMTGKNLLKVVYSSSDKFICSFRSTIWPQQSIRSTLVNDFLMSLSGFIQAHNTEFGDRYVSNFAILSLLLILQPIEKRLAFLQGAVIPGVVMMKMSIATWIVFQK